MPTLLNPRHEMFARLLAHGGNAAAAYKGSGLERRPCAALAGFYVYALIDPRDDRVFYIGKGKGTRYAAHYREWMKSRVVNGPKFERIGAIVAEGKKPETVCLQDGLSEAAAFQLERELIRAIGRKALTNAVGGIRSELEKGIAEIKDALLRLIPYRDWLRLRDRTEDEKAMYHRIVDALKQNLALTEEMLRRPI